MLKWRIDYEKDNINCFTMWVYCLAITGCGNSKNEFDVGKKSDIQVSQYDVSLSIKEGT
ncbi:MAG TPA: hypothetical protein IAC02_07460 [Candidatus Coprovivens excrementavium]|nr:hypothetical protein [Candidatus Coprovivens excrementavium]